MTTQTGWGDTLISPTGVLVLVGALALLLAWQMLRSRVRAKRLMTRVEREVIGHLEAAVPWCPVHAQVCLGALLEPSRWLPRGTRSRLRYSYGSKIVDFVLEDRRTGEVVALVELDDRTHNFGGDAARDQLTSRAGYLTIRLPASEYPTRTNVLARVTGALNAQHEQTSAIQAARAMQDLRAIATGGAPKPSTWSSRKGRRA
jgi:very-short-patch-repair endonuclease